MERRYVEFESLEVREDNGQPPKLVGYAAVFDSEADLGPYREVIKPGAFARSLASGKGVMALYAHDPAKPLGRTDNGTLQLREDAKGLRVEIDVNAATSYGQDALALCRRGDIKGMSFGFKQPKGGASWTRTENGPLCSRSEVDLREVSIVSNPAYGDTSVSVRCDPESLDMAKSLTDDMPNLRTAKLKLMHAMAA